MFRKFFTRRTRYSVLSTQKGMTLIEIMVVVAIIGLIATMAVVNIMGQFEKAKVKTAKTQIKSLEGALEQYYLDNSNYPSTEQGLNALVDGPSDAKRFQPGGYIKKVPNDPWGKEYGYTSPGGQGLPYEITSAGPDKQQGTDDDISSSQE